MAVFVYGNAKKSQNLIVEMQHEDKNFVAGIHFNQKRGSAEVSSIRGLYPKDNAEWLNWIQNSKAIRIDQKDKVQDLISSLRTNPAESARIGLNLDSVAKIVEEFENPKLSNKVYVKMNCLQTTLRFCDVVQFL